MKGRLKLFLLSFIFILFYSYSLISDAWIMNNKNNPIDNGSNFTAAKNPSRAPVESLKRANSIKIGIDDVNGNFNPMFAKSEGDKLLNRLVFEGLTEINSDGAVVTGISDYKISLDGLKYTFTIKKGVNFSNGEAVTAYDVEFTYLLLHDPEYSGAIDVFKTKIEGGAEYYKKTLNKILGIKIKSENTIEFTLSEPDSMALYTFGAPILSREYYGQGYIQGSVEFMESFKMQDKIPYGCGSYILKEYLPGDKVLFYSNKNYWKGVPTINILEFYDIIKGKELESIINGSLDAVPLPISESNFKIAKESEFIDVYSYLDDKAGVICFNNSYYAFKDAKVRQACLYALKKDEIIQKVYGIGAETLNVPISKSSWAFSSDDINNYSYDLVKAGQLLNEAGWLIGKDGIREKIGSKLKIIFTALQGDKFCDELVPILKDSYKSIGIDLVIEYVTFDEMISAINKGSCFMWYSGWNLTPNPDADLIFGTNGVKNKFSYSNSEMDVLFKNIKNETNLRRLLELYKMAYKTINTEVPCMPICQLKEMWVVNARIKNVILTSQRPWTADLWVAIINNG